MKNSFVKVVSSLQPKTSWPTMCVLFSIRSRGNNPPSRAGNKPGGQGLRLMIERRIETGLPRWFGDE